MSGAYSCNAAASSLLERTEPQSSLLHPDAHNVSPFRLQVWVVGAELEPGVLSAGSSSFIVVDFFDFESQATPLLPGVSPAFDFATTFKVRAHVRDIVTMAEGTPSPNALQF